MKVSELAKQLNTTSDVILNTLKSFKLKAKDSSQDLSAGVVSVIKSEFQKRKNLVSPAKEPAKKVQVKEKIKPGKAKSAKEKSVKEKEVLSKPKDVQTKIKETKPLLKVRERETVRPRARISKEPLITLKPLARKKKRTSLTPGIEFKPQTVEAREETSSISQVTAPAPGTVQAAPATSAALAEKEPPSRKLQDLEVKVPVSVKDFSVKIQQKPSVILGQLLRMGIMATINQALDADVVQKLAEIFGFNLVKVKTQAEQVIETHKKEEEDPKLLKQRPPVVTLMGHVDHGKTTLLDKIRKSRVADSEHGGITQHIGAYSVETPKGRITFLDTPGHEAFTAMRARGAHVTDIVILVVAADEGMMPQTEEAIDHAKAAGVPIVVALNKIDHRNANPDLVKKQLNEVGLMPEDWGGKTVVVPVSGLTGQGIDHLLEMILLEAELLELKTNDQKKATGVVVEAHLSRGRGPVSALIVRSGTLKEGDIIIVGHLYGKVKAMFDDQHRPIKEAGPAKPVEVLGLSEVPEAGQAFYVVDDDKLAKEICEKRVEEIKNQRLSAAQKRISLEDLYSQIQKGIIKELNVILKADVQGSLEALKDSLEKIPSDKIRLKFIHLAVGDINSSDVLLAVASDAVIIGFHVGTDSRAKEELEKHSVDVRLYRIIYDAVNDMRKALEGLLEPKTRRKFAARIEVRQVFKLSKHGIIAGCYVHKGRIHRKTQVEILREDKVVYSGTLASLKRFKDDVKEVAEGMECGLSFSGFDQFQPGDIVEAYEIETIAQKL